jgi:predicted P-loop ATPase/GTPase
VEAELAEQYMPYLQEGDQLNVHFPAYPGMVKKTPISREGSVIDKESRTFTIEARIDNYSGKIKPNQICIVKVRDYYNTAAFFIPSNVIKQDMQGDYVYIVQDKEGTKVAHKVYVDKGRSYNNQTMITEGLEKGWKVITSGYTQVSEQSEIVVKQKKNLIDE